MDVGRSADYLHVQFMQPFDDLRPTSQAGSCRSICGLLPTLEKHGYVIICYGAVWHPNLFGCMACYYFLLRDGEFDLDDEEGLELADDENARRKAVYFARELLAAAVIEGHLPLHERLVVEDETGREVISITFGQAVGAEPLKQFHVRLVE
jgi:hypothetical protein